MTTTPTPTLNALQTLTTGDPGLPRTARSRALWAGVLGGPTAWAIQLNLGYMLVPHVCQTGSYMWLHTVTIVFFLVTLACAALSWADYRAAGGGSADDTDGGPVARQRFLGALGVCCSGLSAIAVLAQGAASFFLNACWT